MSAAHPRSSPSSGDLNPLPSSHDPFPQVQRVAKVEGMRNCCGRVRRGGAERRGGGMEGHCRQRGGLRPTPRKSARQLCGTDFHKLHSMGHRYKEGIKRGRKGIGRESIVATAREDVPIPPSAFVSYSPFALARRDHHLLIWRYARNYPRAISFLSAIF